MVWPLREECRGRAFLPNRQRHGDGLGSYRLMRAATGLLARRILWLLPTLFGLVCLTFLIAHVIPADPAALVVGDAATPHIGRSPDEAWPGPSAARAVRPLPSLRRGR